MKTKELIAELQKIPGDYEVQIHLREIPAPDASQKEAEKAFNHIIALSAYVSGAAANHEAKLAYIFGGGLPMPEAFSAGKN